MSTLTYLTTLVQQAIQRLNNYEANAKKVGELPHQTNLNTASKIPVDRAGISEYITVDQIASAIQNGNYNQLLAVGTISVSGTDITVPSGVSGQINGSIYQTTTDTIIPVTLCPTGFSRKDILVLTTSNTVIAISGEETDGAIVLAPPVPIDAIYITEFDVNDNAIGTPSDPILGAQFKKKSESAAYNVSTLTGSNAIIPLDPNGYSEIRLTNASLTSIAGFDLSLITVNANAEVPYNGKPYIIRNLTGNSITIKNELGAADYPFYLSGATDMVFPNNQAIYVSYDPSGFIELFKSWSEVDLSTKLDKSSTPSSVYGNDAMGEPTMIPVSNFQQVLGFTPENVANKSTNIITDQASNVKYPSVKSVFDYIQPEFNIRLKGYAFDSFSEFPTSIQTDAFYIDRESGDVYIGWLDPNIFGDPAFGSLYYKKIGLDLGETSSTAYRGDRGKIAYDHSQTTGNPHGTTKSDVGLGNVDNTSDLNKPISTVTQTALNTKLDKSSTPSSVYTTDAQGLQVMKPISEFQPVGDYVTINTTQTVTGNKTFDDVGLIKKVNTANLYPNQSGGSFAIGGDGGYDRFEFYSLDGNDSDGIGTVRIYSNPEEGNNIRHTSLDGQISSILNINKFSTFIRNDYNGQISALYIDGLNSKVRVEGTTDKVAALGTALITGTKNFEFPDQSGTLALLSDLTDTQNALNLKLPIESPSTTGTVISFTVDKVYGTLTTPETGNITADVTNAKLGVTNIIIHNSGTAPTFDSKFKKLSGSGNYVTGVVNYIYCTYISTTEIIYSINQRA